MSDISAPIYSREAFLDMFDIMRECAWTNTLEQQLLDLWALCTDRDERVLLKELIIDFFILDSAKLSKACQGIDRYINQLGVDAINSYIVAVADVGQFDGSTAGLQSLRLKINPVDDWETRYVSHIPELVNSLKSGDNVFIFDDFIGSGNKIIKKYGWLKNLLTSKGMDVSEFNIKVISFSAMNFGIENIVENLGVDVFTSNVLKRSISEKNDKSEAERKINLMIGIEGKLELVDKNRKLSEYTLGYSKSEALYYWENNSCPNNVFPIFWWKKAKGRKFYRPLLTRAN